MNPTIDQLRDQARELLSIDSAVPILAIGTIALASANVGSPISSGLTRDQMFLLADQLLNQPKSDVIAIFVDQLIRYLETGGSSGTIQVFSGIGDPNGVRTASVPAIYYDLTNPNNPEPWVKTSGTNTNTGWV